MVGHIVQPPSIKGTLPFAAKQTKLYGILLSEISQIKRNAV